MTVKKKVLKNKIKPALDSSRPLPDLSMADSLSSQEEIKKLILIAFHDIKATLVSVQGVLASFIHENEHLFSERAKYYLNEIKNRLFFTERLAKDVVDFTKIGMIVLPAIQVNIKEVIDNLEEEFAPHLREKKINFKVLGPLPIIYASRERILRIFSNLIDNAIKYSRDPGRNPEIIIGWQNQGEQIVFFVKDNGLGISQPHQEVIFELFERLPRAIQLHPQGTGIGLAVVKKIVEMYGGRVWLESQEGQGATFYFGLPAHMLIKG